MMTEARVRRLTAAIRVVWIVVAATQAIVLVPTVSQTISSVNHLCTSLSSCSQGSGIQVTAAMARTLRDSGISLQMYAEYCVALALLSTFAAYLLAAVMISRPSRDPMLLFTAFALLFAGASLNLSQPTGAWSGLAGLLGLMGILFLALLLFVFPNGKFVPRWSPVFVLVFLLLATPLSTTSASNAVWAFLWIGVIGSQIYRYRRVSNPLERQQTKLVVLGIVYLSLVYMTATAFSQFNPSWAQETVPYMFLESLLLTAGLPLIIGMGLALLRYRLWDVDQLISRTLAYAALTAFLAVMYLGLVVGLQAAFRLLTGQQSQLAIAISTLIIAALFNPLRRRFHGLIARTFYRSRYDSGQVLATFGNACRDETDLGALQAMLLGVVDETMQPVSVWLWLPGQHPG